MANTQFVVNSYRYDPYHNFKFRVIWNERVVAGISKVSMLKRSTEPNSHREGGDPNEPRLTPTVWKSEPITLERGITHDLEFENWANLLWSAEGDAGFTLKHFRKNITIQLLNGQGQVVKAYNVRNCWVSEYQALPELDANGNAVAIEMMVLQNEGWERDTSIVEPTQT